MCFNGVSAVNNDLVVSAFVEHTEVNAEKRRIIHGTGHRAFVGSNDHRLFGVKGNVGIFFDKSLQHLVCGTNVIEATVRDRLLYVGVVCVKGNDIGNTHCGKLLQRHCTVERFSCGSAVLSAFIKHGHDQSYTTSLTADRAKHTLDILIMIVGTHGYVHTVHFVSNAVIEDVSINVSIVSSQGFVNDRFTFTGAETGTFCVYKIGRSVLLSSETAQITVNLRKEFVASLHADNAEFAIVFLIHF